MALLVEKINYKKEESDLIRKLLWQKYREEKKLQIKIAT